MTATSSVDPTSIGPLLGRATDAARDDFQDRLNEATAWVEWIRAGAPGAKDCVVCSSEEKTELHHVAGKLNSDLVVPVCGRCHKKLSERQNGWDYRWVEPDNPPKLKEALLLRGLSDLCEERGRSDTAYHLLGKRLRALSSMVGRGAAS
ncbi:MAG: hypothetical protein WCA77_04900 [Thermoplasmata archaeon]